MMHSIYDNKNLQISINTKLHQYGTTLYLVKIYKNGFYTSYNTPIPTHKFSTLDASAMGAGIPIQHKKTFNYT